MTRFFLLVFALSVPFALLGSVSSVQLSPGIPLSALGFICPVTAALILTYRKHGAAAATALVRRSFDFGRTRARVWYVPVILLMPCITTLTWVVARSTGLSVPTPRFTGATIVMFVVFFVAALGEELGWSGYATDPMQERWGALRAAILLGAIWAVWHIVAMVQAGQSPEWIAWGCLDMVGTRVLMVWLYDNTGQSVFATALYHAIANISAKTVFPGGSYHAEQIMSVIIAVVAAIVAVAWRPRTWLESKQPNAISIIERKYQFR